MSTQWVVSYEVYEDEEMGPCVQANVWEGKNYFCSGGVFPLTSPPSWPLVRDSSWPNRDERMFSLGGLIRAFETGSKTWMDETLPLCNRLQKIQGRAEKIAQAMWDRSHPK